MATAGKDWRGGLLPEASPRINTSEWPRPPLPGRCAGSDLRLYKAARQASPERRTSPVREPTFRVRDGHLYPMRRVSTRWPPQVPLDMESCSTIGSGSLQCRRKDCDTGGSAKSRAEPRRSIKTHVPRKPCESCERLPNMGGPAAVGQSDSLSYRAAEWYCGGARLCDTALLTSAWERRQRRCSCALQLLRRRKPA